MLRGREGGIYTVEPEPRVFEGRTKHHLYLSAPIQTEARHQRIWGPNVLKGDAHVFVVLVKLYLTQVEVHSDTNDVSTEHGEQ